MTEEEKITFVSALMCDPGARITPNIIGAYLQDAGAAILRRLYPFGKPESVSDVPDIYATLQCRLAVRYISRIGAEGEISHDENGTNRRYGSVNDEDLLMEITPFAVLGD